MNSKRINAKQGYTEQKFLDILEVCNDTQKHWEMQSNGKKC